MPKMKTKKALAKRVKVSASGTVKRGQAYRSHLAHNKTTKQKRHSKKPSAMHPSDQKRFKGLVKGL